MELLKTSQKLLNTRDSTKNENYNQNSKDISDKKILIYKKPESLCWILKYILDATSKVM